MRKSRLEIHLDPMVMAWLREEAARRGCSLGEIIRRALQRAMEKPD